MDDENSVAVHYSSDTDDSTVAIQFDDSEDEPDDDYFHEYVDLDVIEDIGQPHESFWNEQCSIVAAENSTPNEILLENLNATVLDPEESLSSGYETDTMQSIGESDLEDDIVLDGYTRYNPREMCKNFQFKLGMEFNSIQEFKDAVREYALLHGYDLHFVKNDKVRCRVVCSGECKFLLFVSKVGGSLTYRLKTFIPKHTCGITFTSKLATSKWVASKIVKTMRSNKNMKLADIISSIKDTHYASVSVSKAFKARKAARIEVDGCYIEQYSELWDYMAEVRKRNVGTTFQLQYDRVEIDHPPIFKRIYLCLELVKRGFLNACRPIIGLDGCFLKGPYGGILLVAVARDPNKQYFPLAIAVVESENKDSWTWFMSHLLDDIGDVPPNKWVFISDQQKGLMPMFEEKLRGVEHRLCIRHLYANIKTRFGGGTVVRDLVIQAAKATYVKAWQQKMHELKNVSKEAYNHLMSFDPSCWTKSHFKEYPRSDMILNNITESFNGRLVEARELPMTSMFEWIRTYLMNRFARNRLLAAKYHEKGIVCPKPRRRLNKEVAESGKWEARWAGGKEFEVCHNTHKFVVDLEDRTCSCRWWPLTGIPCRHAVSCIFTSREDPHDYVHRYLKLSSFEDCYAPVIHSINGKNMWEETGMEPVGPPKIHVRPGRPKKLRIRATDEPPKPNKTRKTNTKIRCTACGSYGHNRRTCKNSTSLPSQESIRVTPP